MKQSEKRENREGEEITTFLASYLSMILNLLKTEKLKLNKFLKHSKI